MGKEDISKKKKKKFQQKIPFLARDGKLLIHRMERDGQNYLSICNNVLSATIFFFFFPDSNKEIQVYDIVN